MRTNRKVSENRANPHCWGKMDWILKYQVGMEPNSSICSCEYGSFKCLLLTRQANREKSKTTKNK